MRVNIFKVIEILKVIAGRNQAAKGKGIEKHVEKPRWRHDYYNQIESVPVNRTVQFLPRIASLI